MLQTFHNGAKTKSIKFDKKMLLWHQCIWKWKMAAHHQKYLKVFTNEYLKFTCMPNEYGPAMRIFIKTTNVPFSVLRIQCHTSVVDVDHSYLQEDSYESCLKNVNDTIIMLWSSGITIHPEKSVLKPTQKLIYLGFIINSKIWLWNWQKRKNTKIKTFVPNLSKIKIHNTICNTGHWQYSG